MRVGKVFLFLKMRQTCSFKCADLMGGEEVKKLLMRRHPLRARFTRFLCRPSLLGSILSLLYYLY